MSVCEGGVLGCQLQKARQIFMPHHATARKRCRRCLYRIRALFTLPAEEAAIRLNRCRYFSLRAAARQVVVAAVLFQAAYVYTPPNIHPQREDYHADAFTRDEASW